MYNSVKTYIYLYARNYFLNVLLFEDIHIFTGEEYCLNALFSKDIYISTCEELLSECTNV